MEGEIRCIGSRLSPQNAECVCVVTEWKMNESPLKKKKKKIFFFFLRETPTSPWVPFSAKFWPLGWLFRPSHPPPPQLIPWDSDLLIYDCLFPLLDKMCHSCLPACISWRYGRTFVGVFKYLLRESGVPCLTSYSETGSSDVVQGYGLWDRGKLGRSVSQIGRSYSAKLQHFLPVKKQISHYT